MADEAGDRVRADIEAENLEVVLAQQAFGQVVTNKTVHAEDKYAGCDSSRRKPAYC
ncbi:Uncharacterised protein [Pluralibacter gergoviae]|nr:Uncharacterised protein [Pluralibacter gergoviae]